MPQYVESFKNDFLKSIDRRVEYALDRAERETGVRELQPHWNRGKIVLQEVSSRVPDALGGVRDDVSFKLLGIDKDGVTTNKQYHEFMMLAASLSDDFPNLVQKTMFDLPEKRANIIVGGIERCITSLKNSFDTNFAENPEYKRGLKESQRLVEIFSTTMNFVNGSNSLIEISESFISFLRIAVRKINEMLTYIKDEHIVWTLTEKAGDFQAIIKILTGDFVSRAGMNRVFNDGMLAPVKV